MQMNQDGLCARRLRDSLRLVILLCVVKLSAPLVVGQEHGRGDKAQPNATKATKKTTVDAKTRIDALENHSSAPVVTITSPKQADLSWGYPRFDPKYDWSEYERVDKAIASLVDHAEEAWPELIRHFDDKRYCITLHNDYGCNYSVGVICQLIVRGCLVQGYAKHFSRWFTSGVIRYPKSEQVYYALVRPDMVRSARDLKTWCENRKGKQLYELQIEMCDLAIAKLAKLDYLSDKEREPFLKAIRTEIEELRKSKKAARFPGLYGEGYERYDADSAGKKDTDDEPLG